MTVMLTLITNMPPINGCAKLDDYLLFWLGYLFVNDDLLLFLLGVY